MADDGSDTVSQRTGAGGNVNRSAEAASCRNETSDFSAVRTVSGVHLAAEWIVSNSSASVQFLVHFDMRKFNYTNRIISVWICQIWWFFFFFFFQSTAQLQYVEDSEPVTRST